MKHLALILTLIFTICLFAQANVIAEVNGSKITVEDLNVYATKFGSENMVNNLSENMKEEILNMLIGNELILTDAKTKGLESDPVYTSKLDAYKKKALLDTYMEKVVKPSIEVSEEELMNYYKNDPRYYQPERNRIIMIASDTMDETKVRTVLNNFSLNKNNDENSENVMPYEELPGYDIKLFDVTEKDYFTESNPDLWGKSVGSLVGPFEFENRTNIAKILEKVPEKATPLAEVKDEIIDRIKTYKLEEAKRAKSEELRKNAKITINNDVLYKK